MKKVLVTLIIIVLIIIIFLIINKGILPNSENSITILSNEENNINKNSVSYNGWIHTDGYKLLNEKNEIIQLKGISSHGIEWFSELITYENLEKLKNDWNINIFRIAMYTDSKGEGYIFNKETSMQKVCNIVDMAIELDMYVIVDWHILNDNNPQTYKNDAKLFFDEISKKYANVPNVIYEICNEPNGNEVTWDKHIKPYANEIIPIIRKNSEKSLILVGTPDWCKKIEKAADNPLNFSNIAYTCHFYSGTDGSELREKIDYCIEKNIPIFVSECGLTSSNGDGPLFLNEFNEWIDYLNSKNISWIYWSFSNKNESSAIILSNYNINNTNNNINSSTDFNIYSSNNNSTDFNNYLSQSGIFIKNLFLSYN